MLERCATSEGARPAECDEPLQTFAKKMTLLEVGTTRHRATHVYFCRELTRKGRERDPWRCQSAVTEADDTLHTTEGEFDPIELSAPAALRLFEPRPGPASGLIKAGFGPALELHADGYVAARRLTAAEDGTLALPNAPPNRTLLLFALYRHDERWVRKHVWVLRSR